MRLFRPGLIARCLYPEALFRIRTSEKVLCLTFDDGPDPESTVRLLDILGRYDVKALFFCNGSSAEKYPDLIREIRIRGHVVGNHGYSHLNGWITPVKRYMDDVSLASPLTSSEFFRPPYGRLRIDQYHQLKGRYRILFWDIMPYDFDNSFGINNSFKILKKKIRPGSIIVLHDDPQSASTSLLDIFIDYSIQNGYQFILPSMRII